MDAFVILANSIKMLVKNNSMIHTNMILVTLLSGLKLHQVFPCWCCSLCPHMEFPITQSWIQTRTHSCYGMHMRYQTK